MKKHPFIFSVVLGLILPWLMFSAAETFYHREQSEQEIQFQSTQPAESVMLNVQMPDGEIETLEIEAYLVGVLLGEMPANFEIEALKAQAVAARTFALKSMKSNYKHKTFDLCTDSSCCQNYYRTNSYLADGGTQDSVDKVSSAVAESAARVLLYNGELIEATFFSCSGGKTEDALAVWGTDVPYLQAIDSPGEENATHYMDTIVLSVHEFQRKLSRELSGLPGNWIENVSYTAGGGVDTIKIGGQTYTGMEIRKLLGLNSTAFIISQVGDSFTITTKGFGHRVGMSQYGADAMAVAGKSYEEILTYYYPGTYLSDYRDI